MSHFIAMSGLHGYLPNMVDLCETYDAAVGVLAQVHELGRDRTRKLRREGYLELDLRRDGNEYAEVEECTCDTPEVHA